MNLTRTVSRLLTRTLRAARRIPFIGESIVKASFDAVRQTWGDRSFLFQSLQDAWLEIDALTRKELQRLHDSLIENSCVVQKIRNLHLQFSVGPSGLLCTPNASNWSAGDPATDTTESKTRVEDWNHSRAQSWGRWFRAPELNSDISGSQLTRVWSGLLFDKGEIFVHLTQQDVKNSRGALLARTPRTETIDAHRCETPESMREYNGNYLIDGIEINPAGLRIAAWFKKTNFDALLTGGITGRDLYTRIEFLDKQGKRQLIHKFKHRRPGQMRGIPEGFSVYNLVRDNMDLHKLEMQAAKLASDIANVETNATGELDALNNRKSRIGYTSQTASGVTQQKTGWADYKVSIGSKNIALHQGDKLEQFMISRPTVATQDYWDLHYTMICLGYNVPKMLVMPYSLQGTVTRADLDICGYGFGREAFEIISELLREVYEWQTEWAVQYDRTMDGDAPEDYLGVVIRPPRAPNVDIGYTAKSLETELKLGVKTIPDVYAEKQMDFRQKTREIAEYLKFVQDTAKEFGVSPGQITELATAQAAPDPNSATALEPEDEEETLTKQVTHP